MSHRPITDVVFDLEEVFFRKADTLVASINIKANEIETKIKDLNKGSMRFRINPHDDQRHGRQLIQRHINSMKH